MARNGAETGQRPVSGKQGNAAGSLIQRWQHVGLRARGARLYGVGVYSLAGQMKFASKAFGILDGPCQRPSNVPKGTARIPVVKAVGLNGAVVRTRLLRGKTVGVAIRRLRRECGGGKSRAQQGGYGAQPRSLLLQVLPRARAARRSKATRPPLGAKGARGTIAAADRLRQAGRRDGVGRQGHGQGGTIDADGLRPLHDKTAVKRRMHPQFTRTASGF